MRERLTEIVGDALSECLKHMKEKNLATVSSDFIIDRLLENGVIVPPCKFGDTVYVIPSETNRKLNAMKGFGHLNRVYEQKISKIEIFANNKYLLTTCDGLQSVHCDLYKETWFLTQEEAERALRKDEGK